VEGHIFNSSPTLSTRSPAGTARTCRSSSSPTADGRRLHDPDPDWEIEGEVSEDYRRVKLSRLHPGEQFAYVFDLGDDWAHPCTAAAWRIDPAEVLGDPARHAATVLGPGATFPTSTGAARTALFAVVHGWLVSSGRLCTTQPIQVIS
jgi:hypothetical protein